MHNEIPQNIPGKMSAPAAERNAPHLIKVLGRVLPPQGTVLEIASGSGYHAVAFAKAMPQLTWQPSDAEENARASIAAHRAESNLINLHEALALDVQAHPWPVGHIDAVVCINMIHISPWAATQALFAGATKLLASNAPLVTYGPYIMQGDFISESNVAFDQSLKARNALWGLREIDDLTNEASMSGFRLEETVPMPANNFTLVWRKVR